MREVTKVSQECLRKPVGTDYNCKLHFQYIIITKTIFIIPHISKWSNVVVHSLRPVV